MTDRTPAPLRPMPDDWQRALAVVAHPDDLEYGCSAAVASWVADGRQITYVLATRGEAGIDTLPPERARTPRESEQRAAAAAVGVPTVEFLDHRDTWGHGTWNTPDHVAVGRAVPDAVADAGNRRLFPGLTRQGLRPWNGVRWVAVADSPAPTHAVPAEPGSEQAVRSLPHHRACIETLTDEDPETYARRFLADGTHAHGPRFGGRPTVAFELFGR